MLVTQSPPTLQPHELDGAHQAPLSTGFSRRESWDGLPFLSPGDLTDPGIEPQSPALQTDSLLSEAPGKPLFLAKQDLHFKFLLLVWLIGSYCLATVPRPGSSTSLEDPGVPHQLYGLDPTCESPFPPP